MASHRRAHLKPFPPDVAEAVDGNPLPAPEPEKGSSAQQRPRGASPQAQAESELPELPELPEFPGAHSGMEGLAPEVVAVVAELAHDFRSPLTSILFLADTLRRGHSGELNAIQLEQVRLIYGAALALLGVANDAVSLVGSRETLLDPEPTPISIAELFDSVRDMVQPLAEIKELEIRASGPAADQKLGHALALRRILLNLTTNAVQSTDSGYVEIAAEDSDRGRVLFRVSDTGPGIPPEEVETLFEPFRARGGREGQGGGMPFAGRGLGPASGPGLGLHICRKLVHELGGDLRLRTKVGEGTTFFFTLPMQPAPRL